MIFTFKFCFRGKECEGMDVIGGYKSINHRHYFRCWCKGIGGPIEQAIAIEPQIHHHHQQRGVSGVDGLYAAH